MSRQRSSQPTSGRSSQSGASRTSTTGASATTQGTTQGELQGGGLGGGQFEGQSAGMVEQAKEKTQELAGQVQQKATQRVESGLARGKSQAAETLNVVAQSLINTGQQLREQNQGNIGNYVDQAADRMQRVSNYLQNTDVSEIVDRTEEFARRRPALFLGGAFALGLLGARFLKSSRRQQTAGGGQWAAAGGARTGQGYSRERSVPIDQEVPTPGAQREWAAAGTSASGFADRAGTNAETGQQSESGFGRKRDPIDFGLPPGGH